ncbi:endolytic transglycosylase MltG [Microbacterium trichothecenolyticum]|uniref:endolytic transglycosylase MltG n=1 Tax=Microbacterium trichothecenolyticum TaxID=69370 RepID=UPI001C6EB85B|nr:endolytic transglycosylase MltG [Microbacterium trichothecenolyticum]MBW9118988.1 endolytic transglycosylase MltG [Microbacterium trichothecenolyticum]
MPDSSPDGEAVPRSRRAAREAAARQAATGETPTTPASPAPSAPAAAPGAQPGTWESLITGSTPVSGNAPGATAPGATAPASPPAAPAVDQPASGSGFQPVPLRTPRPQTQPIDVEAPVDDDPWIFAAAGASPAMPYSRGGAAPAGAPATAVAAATPAARGTSAPRDEDHEPSAPSGSLEDLFSGSASTNDIGHAPPPPNKKRRRIGGWIALGVVLLILGGIAAGGLYVWNTYEDKIREVMGWEEPKDYEAGLANGEAFVTIAQGDTGSPISQSLYDAGVTKTPDAFYDYLITSGQNPTFQPGVYRLQQKMTSEAALAMLLDPANKQEFTAQIPEGFTVEGTLQRISEGTGIPLEELTAAAADPAAYGVPADPAIAAAGGQPLEGWLFPATYTFDPGVTAQSAIQTLVDRTKQSLDAAGVPQERRQEILTTASIIQREARAGTDMQKVARVILNRLDPSNQETFGKLQMDSTAQYGYGEMHDGTVSSSEAALNDPNPWNTYVHTGLPVGPIANPGDVAIDAAMHPAEGPWLYFVTVNLNTGETQFSSTYGEHLKYVEQWQQWCRDNPDQGC